MRLKYSVPHLVTTRPTALTEEVDINKAVAAIIDIEDYKTIIKALATTKEALMEALAEVDSIIEPDINKRSTISIIR